MIDFGKYGNWISWRSIRPHLCTLAVALSFGSSWRAPRDAFRYGGLPTALVITIAGIVVALPAALMQLAVGQLSQQDAVGIWRAVPFFKGVGYTRLLISFIGALYTIVYVAMLITYIFYTISNPITFSECSEILETPEGDIEIVYNATSCVNESLLAPIGEEPEYYIALAFIVILLWILFPFTLYNPVKLMKRIFYAFGLFVFLLGTFIVSFVGDRGGLPSIANNSDWINFVQPNIWHSAIVQALISNQIAGGYLISSGDSIYANTNVQWTAVIFVAANILFGWVGVLFWFAVGGSDDKSTNNLAVIVQIYKATVEKNLSTVWPILMFAMLSFSGMINMIVFLYPLYDRFRRVGGHKWRYLSVGSSVVGAVGAFAIFIIGPSAFLILEDVIMPCLVSVTAALEISAFIFVYGWKVLVEDIEFLIGNKLPKCWVWGWCTSLGVIVPFTVWWVVACFIGKPQWTEPPWEAAGIITSASTLTILLLAFAAVSVAKQVQYDILGKLKSSFRPSRHWGPRDPITHHYWLTRREDGDHSVSRVRFRRRQLGQLSGITSSPDILKSQKTQKEHLSTSINRSNSDDLLMVCRKDFVAQLNQNNIERRKRSKSLDWDVVPRIKLQDKYHNLIDCLTSADSISSKRVKNNNNIVKSGLE